MGGWNARDRPKTILKGKSNYDPWVVGTMMELRTQEAAEALEEELITNPESLEKDEETQAISNWLSELDEVPNAGWSS